MKKIRIGQIGTKHDHARDHMDCVRKFPDIFEVVGVVEEDEEQRRLVENDPSYSDYPFMTEEQLFDAGCDAIMVEVLSWTCPMWQSAAWKMELPCIWISPQASIFPFLRIRCALQRERDFPCSWDICTARIRHSRIACS